MSTGDVVDTAPASRVVVTVQLDTGNVPEEVSNTPQYKN